MVEQASLGQRSGMSPEIGGADSRENSRGAAGSSTGTTLGAPSACDALLLFSQDRRNPYEKSPGSPASRQQVLLVRIVNPPKVTPRHHARIHQRRIVAFLHVSIRV